MSAPVGCSTGHENEGNIGVTLEWEGEGNHETLEDGVSKGLSRLWGANTTRNWKAVELENWSKVRE